MVSLNVIDKAKIMDDREIRMMGIEVLYKSLAALRFLSLLYWEPTDYVEISRRLYAEQTIDEIFARARQNWQE
ncbi:MAG: hypothetical protein EBE86_008270 [Hormoscilla sp. GUM202]|nr:hypothetical protein [Hormoscilla sp. GUM202]